MEQLKQFALDVHNFAFSTKYDDLDIVSAMDLDSVVEELNKDEDKMYKQIQELQEQLNEESQQRLKNKECWMTVKDKYWELNKENEELKDKVDTLEQQTEGFRVEYPKLKKENEELKKQIKDLLAAS